jgi:hypothetical protein
MGHPVYSFIFAVVALASSIVGLIISLRLMGHVNSLTQEVKKNGIANVGTGPNVDGHPNRSVLPEERSEQKAGDQ